MDKNYSLRDIADLLGEPLHSARNWHRLPADNPRSLPTVLDKSGDIARLVISRENLARWLRRNPDLAERVLSLYAPPAIRETLLPRAIASTLADELRGNPLPEPSNTWWDALPIDTDHATEQHQGESA